MLVERENDQVQIFIKKIDGKISTIKEHLVWNSEKPFIPSLVSVNNIDISTIRGMIISDVAEFDLLLIPGPFRIGAWAYHERSPKKIKLERFHIINESTKSSKRYIYEGLLIDGKLEIAFYAMK